MLQLQLQVGYYRTKLPLRNFHILLPNCLNMSMHKQMADLPNFSIHLISFQANWLQAKHSQPFHSWWSRTRNHNMQTGAGDGTQTRDPQLGRLMLYQLSYSRFCCPTLLRRYFSRMVGRAGFEPTKAYASRFTVCPSWPLWYLPEYCI